jgi:hypothetical protein
MRKRLGHIKAGVYTVPAMFVSHLRAGLHLQLGEEADAISHLSLWPREQPRSTAYNMTLARVDDLRALLGLTGWDERHPERDVPVNLYRHGDSLASALRFIAEQESVAGDEDAQTVYGLRFYASGVEGLIAKVSTPPAGRARRIAADVLIAARAARSRDRERLRTEARALARRTAIGGPRCVRARAARTGAAVSWGLGRGGSAPAQGPTMQPHDPED